MIDGSSVSYFPELENNKPVNSSKWGILNVHLAKCSQVRTGYQWKYQYFDGFKIRIISSYDLKKLRRKIEGKGLPWIITDIKFATDAYDLNRVLLKKHAEVKKQYKNNRSNSGVKYVYKSKDIHARRGFYWMYVVPKNCTTTNQKTFCSSKLENLRERILGEGLEWNIVNYDLYNKIIKDEEALP
ncbi:MAG: hypothetical protein IJH63_00605 [Methanobrevibacter sp.]|nr:hypothetical protein [Methanosphaera sp.]MBR0369204.1 hypothetical protein [Methanobrevibacter sp.]